MPMYPAKLEVDILESSSAYASSICTNSHEHSLLADVIGTEIWPINTLPFPLGTMAMAYDRDLPTYIH